MFSKVIVSSLLLATLANGLVFKRDDGDNTDTSPTPLPPTVTPQPILLPDPTFSLSLPPLDPTPVVSSPADLIYYSSSPSVVTTTVYVYPTQCSQSGPLSPVPGPSGDSDDDDDDDDDDNDTQDDLSSGGELNSISLPDVQPTPSVLPPTRRSPSRRLTF